MEFVFLIVFWMICGSIAAVIAESKGGDRGLWVVIGFLLGPFGIFASFFVGSDEARDRIRVVNGKAKRCPMCAETVLAEAVICKHCGHDFYAEFKDVPE